MLNSLSAKRLEKRTPTQVIGLSTEHLPLPRWRLLLHFNEPIAASYRTDRHMKVANWIKRLGFWGFLFFLVKGLLWLTVPAMLAILAN